MKLKLDDNTTWEPLIMPEQLCNGCDERHICVTVFDCDGFPVNLCHECLVDLANELL